jgi:YHS domain-containing protein
MIEYAIDPVCETTVDKVRASFDRMTAQYKKVDRDNIAFDRVTGAERGENYYFCSERCKQMFELDPERYINKSRSAGTA